MPSPSGFGTIRRTSTTVGIPTCRPLGKISRCRTADFSNRDKEIVQLLAQGYRNKEIAGKLFISEQTVKNHLHSIFGKLGVSDRLELALYAIHHRLIEHELPAGR